jgi:hypothetical protein
MLPRVPAHQLCGRIGAPSGRPPPAPPQASAHPAALAPSDADADVRSPCAQLRPAGGRRPSAALPGRGSPNDPRGIVGAHHETHRLVGALAARRGASGDPPYTIEIALAVFDGYCV